MKPARIALFLQLCLVVGIATAQSPEQEMQAEAQKLLPMLFSKCGEDYYSKRTFKYKTGTAYVIGQYKGLAPRIMQQKIMKRDAAKGIEWKGTIRFTGTSSREFSHGMHFSHGQRVPPTVDAWTEWKPVVNLPTYFFLIEKRNGEISIKRRTPQGITPIPCNEVPKG